MIDPAVERLVALTRAARFLNPSRPPHLATLHRWVSRGVGGIVLESVKVGGIRYTSREAIARFVHALNVPGTVPEPASAAAEAADRKLAAMGA